MSTVGSSCPRDRGRITILFDTDDPKQDSLLRAFKMSFGRSHAQGEDLDPSRYRCLNLLPGGAREAQR
jgi:hypothetical protein